MRILSTLIKKEYKFLESILACKIIQGSLIEILPCLAMVQPLPFYCWFIDNLEIIGGSIWPLLSVAHLLQLVVHFDAGSNFPASGHVPGGVDPVPHPRLGLAVHYLVVFIVVFVS